MFRFGQSIVVPRALEGTEVVCVSLMDFPDGPAQGRSCNYGGPYNSRHDRCGLGGSLVVEYLPDNHLLRQRIVSKSADGVKLLLDTILKIFKIPLR